MDKINQLTINKTKIFTDKTHFEQRTDRSINGVSREFAMMHPHWIEQNAHNTSCWECIECQDCYRCVSCINCQRCNTSENCTNCKKCVWVYMVKKIKVNSPILLRNKINETI